MKRFVIFGNFEITIDADTEESARTKAATILNNCNMEFDFNDIIQSRQDT